MTDNKKARAIALQRIRAFEFAYECFLFRMAGDPAKSQRTSRRYLDARERLVRYLLKEPPADTRLAKLRANVQATVNVIKPNIVLGDEDSIDLTPHQVGMREAYEAVLRAIDMMKEPTP